MPSDTRRRTPPALAGILLLPLLVGAGAGCGDAEVPGPGPGPGPAPEELPRPLLVVADKGSAAVSFVDPAAGEEVARADAPDTPHETAVSPDGALAFATGYGGAFPGNRVAIFDLEDGSFEGTIPLDQNLRPHGIAAASDGTLWITSEDPLGRVLRLDPDGRAILATVETGQDLTHMLVLIEGADRLYATNIASDNVTVVDTEAGSVVTQIATGDGPEGIAASPGGDRVYVAHRGAGTLVEIDAETNEVVRSLDVGDVPLRVQVVPSGEEALLTDFAAGELIAVDLTSWSVSRRLEIGEGPLGLLVTPDGSTAYVSRSLGDEVVAVDLESWSVVEEIPVGLEPDGLAWAP